MFLTYISVNVLTFIRYIGLFGCLRICFFYLFVVSFLQYHHIFVNFIRCFLINSIFIGLCMFIIWDVVVDNNTVLPLLLYFKLLQVFIGYFSFVLVLLFLVCCSNNGIARGKRLLLEDSNLIENTSIRYASLVSLRAMR